MAYDPRVVRAIAREARRRYGRRGYTKAEKRKIRSAFQTGIVESGLRQLSYGDADSVGWRQQRASLYPDAGNLRKSVRNYFNEADQLYRGDTAASLAGRVQRPASQYLYRYGQHRDEGIRLLRKHVLGRGPTGGGHAAGRRAVGPQTVQGAAGGSSGGLGVAELLSSELARVPQRQSAPLADPGFSAKLALPEGYRDVPSSGSSQVPVKGLAGQLAALSSLEGPDLPNSGSVPGIGSRPSRGFTGRLGYVGDSLGVGTVPQLKELGVRVKADVLGGRPSNKGIGALKHLLSKRDYQAIVWDLGTNDWTAKTTRESLARARRLAPNTTFVLPTVHGRHAARKNRIIRSMAGPGVKVVDWAARSHPSDGIHPGSAGYARRAHMIARAIGYRPQPEPRAGRGGGQYGVPRGRTLGAPIDRAGVGTHPVVRNFVERLAGSLGRPVQYGTGTAHSQFTTTGGTSEHWSGRAIDLPATGRALTEMGAHALRMVGYSRSRARAAARRGGIFNVPYRGRRYQIIVNTTQGGNHYNHLHVGIA